MAGAPGRAACAGGCADRVRQDLRCISWRQSTGWSGRVWQAALPDETRIVYVSPLKALSNDIQRNLEAPLAGIREELAALNLPDVAIRAVVRTGDTSQSERAGMRRKPPHIVVTTPESLVHSAGIAVRPGHACHVPDGDRR